MNEALLLNDDNKKLILSIAKKFYGEVHEDLYQAGVLGLLKAYKNYKKDGTTKFSSYAYKYIYGEMYNLVNSKAIKVNADLIKLSKKIEKVRSVLTQKFGKVASNRDIALFLGISESKIEEALNSVINIVPLESEDKGDICNTIKYSTVPDTDYKILIDESMNILNNSEKMIIKARFYDDLTQSEVARKLSMTQVMVSRYEKQSLSKMYAFMQR